MSTRLTLTAIASALTLTLMSTSATAGKYDNSVLDNVSRAEFIELLMPNTGAATAKVFTRTALPRSGDNRCAVSNGRANSKAISKLSVVAGEGAGSGAAYGRQDALPEIEPADVVPYYGNQVATVNLAVRFANDSDRLSEKDKQLLGELAMAMSSPQLQSTTYAVVGHTDASGSLIRNLELSCARAISARNYLISQGVDARRLTPYGFGPDRPLLNVAPTSATNRRVEVSRAN